MAASISLVEVLPLDPVIPTTIGAASSSRSRASSYRAAQVSGTTMTSAATAPSGGRSTTIPAAPRATASAMKR